MKTHMDALIHHFLIVAEGFNVPPGEVYQPIEGSKGELGVYVKSDGGPKPARVHVRGPSFVNLSALPDMVKGEMVADVVAVIGSIDIVLGEIDR
jgi:NADH-quinone oxidoreductase subunit D